MLVLILNFWCMWFIRMFRCSLFMLLMMVWLVLEFRCILKVGFFLVSFWIDRFSFFWLFLVFGLMVILIIGLGKVIDFSMICWFGLFKVLLVVVFLRLIIV